MHCNCKPMLVRCIAQHVTTANVQCIVFVLSMWEHLSEYWTCNWALGQAAKCLGIYIYIFTCQVDWNAKQDDCVTCIDCYWRQRTDHSLGALQGLHIQCVDCYLPHSHASISGLPDSFDWVRGYGSLLPSDFGKGRRWCPWHWQFLMCTSAYPINRRYIDMHNNKNNIAVYAVRSYILFGLQYITRVFLCIQKPGLHLLHAVKSQAVLWQHKRPLPCCHTRLGKDLLVLSWHCLWLNGM